MIDVEAVMRWRGKTSDSVRSLDSVSKSEPTTLTAIDAALWRVFTKPPAGYARPAWQELGITRRQAAGLLLEVLAALHVELTGKPLDALPPYADTICRYSAIYPDLDHHG